MNMFDTVTGIGQHQTSIEVKYLCGGVTMETAWVDTPDMMVFSVFTRAKAIKLAWAIFKAALTFRRFR